MIDLQEIAEEIREIVKLKQQKIGLTFEEDEHIYTMNGKKDYPSVSKVLKCFYDEFDSETISYNKAGGDLDEQKRLLKEWSDAGDYATNMGSRTHFILEKKSLEIFGIEKEVRQPVFDCDVLQIQKSDSMVQAGIEFLNLMKKRNAALIDTEMVLGSPELGYTGTPDKLWVMENKEQNGIVILTTDYKTNKPKNFVANKFTKKMKTPFNNLQDTALSHYFIQLPLYGKLLMNMLKGSKYEDVKFAGGVVVLLKDDSEFIEYKIPKDVVTTVMDMDIKKYLTNLKK